MPDPLPIVWFDSDCVICSRWVRFILKHEASPSLRFGQLSSKRGKALTQQFVPESTAETIILQQPDGSVQIRSDAVLEICNHLKWPWCGARVLRVLPRALRDLTYNLVSTNRHRLVSETAQCPVPTSELRQRLVES